MPILPADMVEPPAPEETERQLTPLLLRSGTSWTPSGATSIPSRRYCAQTEFFLHTSGPFNRARHGLGGRQVTASGSPSPVGKAHSSLSRPGPGRRRPAAEGKARAGRSVSCRASCCSQHMMVFPTIYVGVMQVMRRAHRSASRNPSLMVSPRPLAQTAPGVARRNSLPRHWKASPSRHQAARRRRSTISSLPAPRPPVSPASWHAGR